MKGQSAHGPVINSIIFGLHEHSNISRFLNQISWALSHERGGVLIVLLSGAY